MLVSLGMSFTKWNVLGDPSWIGLANYEKLWADVFDSQGIYFWQSLKVTTIYTLLEVPLRVALNVAVAVMLNEKLKGIALYRTLLYSPSVIPIVATAQMWVWILYPDGGLASMLLNGVGLPNQSWLVDERTALLTVVGMGLWGFGNGMLICLAGLQSIPEHLYEAANIDGANWWHRFRHVTVPMLSPVIFFVFITSMMGSFQVFDVGYLITQGGPNYATHFYVLNLYNYGWRYFQMGLAASMAWVLFVIILAFTLLSLRSSAAWVYYEGEVRKG
jgi:multiple sugar transport system permease protein